MRRVGAGVGGVKYTLRTLDRVSEHPRFIILLNCLYIIIIINRDLSNRGNSVYMLQSRFSKPEAAFTGVDMSCNWTLKT